MNYRALAVLVMCASVSSYCCAAQQSEQIGCNELVAAIEMELPMLLPQTVKNKRGELAVLFINADDGGCSVTGCSNASPSNLDGLAVTLSQMGAWRNQLIRCREQNPERKPSPVHRPFGLSKSPLQKLIDALDTRVADIYACRLAQAESLSE